MLDNESVDAWKQLLCNRFTAEELIELLGVSVEEVFERFLDECLELDREVVE
jgi:hypothetical protein